MSEGTVWNGGNGASLILRPDRSAFHETERALFLADVHLGKAGHFRKHGMAVPSGVNAANLQRMDAAVQATGALWLVVLGDLFHSERNADWDEFIAWRHGTDLERVTLVQGNHDILEASDWKAAGLEVTARLEVGGLTCTHAPEDWEAGFGVHLCGHVHPGVRLKGRGKQTLSAPCWWNRAPGTKMEQLVFPAFGGFTGKHIVQPGLRDLVFIPAGKQVIRK